MLNHVNFNFVTNHGRTDKWEYEHNPTDGCKSEQGRT